MTSASKRSSVLYRTLVADPPWAYPQGFARNKGGRYTEGTNTTETAPLPYESMTLGDIKRLRGLVDGIAEKDSWLWLWTTDRWLPHAFEVVDAWGFAYCQTFIWHKSDGHPRFPTTFAPIRSEYLLACRRGHPKRKSITRSNVIDVPFNPARLQHSQKPDAFLDLIEELCDGPYVELFARRARFGWDYWGNESLQTVAEAV